MAKALSYFQGVFKNLGKLIIVGRMVGNGYTDSQNAHVQDADLTVYKVAAMGAVDQAVSGAAGDYTTYHEVMKPFADQVNAVVSSLDRLPAVVKAACENYLKKVVAIDVGLTSSATVAAIIAALSGEMHGATGGQVDVLPSGLFANYFKDNWNGVIPTDADPAIPDSYVDIHVV